jgi:hypothetical protein
MTTPDACLYTCKKIVMNTQQRVETPYAAFEFWLKKRLPAVLPSARESSPD